MTLDQLRIYVEVAERGHVTRAAEALGMSQSAVSAAIAMLEPVNPVDEPQGELPLDSDVMVRWHSEPLFAGSQDLSLGSPLSSHSFSFFKVTVTLARPDRDPWFTFEMRKAGHSKLNVQPPM